MASKRLETAKEYIECFATCDTQTLERILASNYHHKFAPSSLDISPPLDKQGFIARHSRIHIIMTGFPVTGNEYIESESSNQVTVWATSVPHWRDEARSDDDEPGMWDYKGEYIFMMWFDDEGRIQRVVEFLDSKMTENALVLVKKAFENVARNAEKVGEHADVGDL
ncbi:hypothetical protein B0J11DRAFT_574843 [Dendryphion nanum]|uniref:SnoaL-like domain-containing protein n=1 Tax=Dendryphion nanum TaxID=256645 RepID=A0A9P9EKR0_9PLEO|nr:hypothetical protein B0J11DRAFT_574843 [Dendryphion nanum]